jgi:hypothetical protein
MYFGDLKDIGIKVLFSTKKRSKGESIVLGSMMKTSELIKFLTKDEQGSFDGFDYVMILDEKAMETLPQIDKERIIRHELRHCYLFFKDDGGFACKLVDHDIQDFAVEVELNKDDIRWKERCTTLIDDIYEQEKEEEKSASKGLLKRKK